MPTGVWSHSKHAAAAKRSYIAPSLLETRARVTDSKHAANGATVRRLSPGSYPIKDVPADYATLAVSVVAKSQGSHLVDDGQDQNKTK
jgi:hypothetical protein